MQQGEIEYVNLGGEGNTLQQKKKAAHFAQIAIQLLSWIHIN